METIDPQTALAIIRDEGNKVNARVTRDRVGIGAAAEQHAGPDPLRYRELNDEEKDREAFQLPENGISIAFDDARPDRGRRPLEPPSATLLPPTT